MFIVFENNWPVLPRKTNLDVVDFRFIWDRGVIVAMRILNIPVWNFRFHILRTFRLDHTEYTLFVFDFFLFGFGFKVRNATGY